MCVYIYIYTHTHTHRDGNVTWLYQVFTWCVSDVTWTENVRWCMSVYTISSNDDKLLTASSYSTASIWWSLALAFSFVRLEVTLADSNMLVWCLDRCLTCQHSSFSHTCTYCKCCKLLRLHVWGWNQGPATLIYFSAPNWELATLRYNWLSQRSVDLGFNRSLCFLSYRIKKREITCYWKVAIKLMRPQQWVSSSHKWF
jgi:hypothetical protein